MPVLIDQRVCDNSPGCSAIRVCPKDAIIYDRKAGKITADNSRCTSCGICQRVCPAGAVKVYPTEAALEAAKTEIEGSNLTADDLLEQRYGVRPGDPNELGTNMVHVDCGNFADEVLKSDLPVVVDFWASWCAPCRILAPTFKDLAAEFDGQLRFAKLDTEECQQVPAEFGIMSIPTMLFFHKGRIVERAVGALPKDALRTKIKNVMTKVGAA